MKNIKLQDFFSSRTSAAPADYLLILAAFLLILAGTAKLHAQKFEGLAPTPPMGWNSWNIFGTDIHEQLVRDIADAFVELGLRDAGYRYIVLDDGWMLRERDGNGNLVPDPEKFPSGMKALADYVHERGLKFGLYNCAGDKTCAGYAGSRGHEYQDALQYASWGVDYLKYDWCSTEKLNAEEAYKTMRDALHAAGRPVVFSICEWGDNDPWLWGKNVGHMWRTSGDIINCFDCQLDHGTYSSWGFMKIAHMRKGIRIYAGPDHWNDLDMMEVGNGMSQAEDRSHFALWSMMASPLIMGNDLRIVSDETLEILTSEEIIAVNQDPLGIQGFMFMDEQGVEIWVKPLGGGDWAVCFLNRNDVTFRLKWDWNYHPLEDSFAARRLDTGRRTFCIRDLYNKENLGTTGEVLEAEIQAHDVLMLRLSAQ